MTNNIPKTKKIRQAKIIEIIGKYNISTQEELADHLRNAGFDSTQATVSRDIRELQLTKAVGAGGEYKYIIPDQAAGASENKFERVLTDATVGYDTAGNLLIVKTYSGMANAACAAIDMMKWDDVVGSLAGDDTIFIACHSPEGAIAVKNKLSSVLKK